MAAVMTHRGLALRLSALGVVQYLVARFCLLLQLPGTNSSPIWLPSGVAVVAVGLWGPCALPMIYCAGFLVNLLTVQPSSVAYAVSLQIALGHIAQASLVGLMLRRMLRVPLEQWTHANALWMLSAAAAGAVISAFIGTAALWIHTVVNFAAVPMVLSTWAIGDFLGMCIVVPPLLFFLESDRWPIRKE